jgi:hypothetical protein
MTILLPSLSPNKLSPGKSPSQFQQSVSLGRSTAVNVAGGGGGGGGGGDESAGLSLTRDSGNGGGECN